MPKRKRGEAADSNSEPNAKSRRSRPQTARLEQTIENGCQMLHRALKTARGFERQKLGRRQKTARGNKDEGEQHRLDAEVKALKVLGAFLYAMLPDISYQRLTTFFLFVFLGSRSQCHC